MVSSFWCSRKHNGICIRHVPRVREFNSLYKSRTLHHVPTAAQRPRQAFGSTVLLYTEQPGALESVTSGALDGRTAIQHHISIFASCMEDSSSRGRYGQTKISLSEAM